MRGADAGRRALSTTTYCGVVSSALSNALLLVRLDKSCFSADGVSSSLK